jgi:c-di-GMP-binding flagellar brake protein YcgR
MPHPSIQPEPAPTADPDGDLIGAALVDDGAGGWRPVSLRIGAGHLWAHAEGGVAAVLGGYTRRVPLDAISAVEEGDGLVLVAAGPRSLRLRGVDPAALQRLRARCAEPPTGPVHAPEAFSVQLGIDGGAPVPGRLELLAGRLRFSPGDPLDGAQIIDVEIAALEAIRQEDGQLSAEVGGRQLRVQGPALDTLMDALRAGEGPRARLPPRRSWPATLRLGPIPVAGRLVVSASELRFRPVGLVEAVVGAGPTDISLTDVHRLTLHGWPWPALHVASARGRLSFLMDDAAERFQALTDLLHHALAGLDEGPGGAESWLQSVVQRWAEVLPLEGEPVALARPGLALGDSPDLRVGALILTDRRLLFLPAGGPAGAAPAEQHLIADLTRLHSADERWPQAVRLRCGGRDHRYVVAGGPELLQRFWDRCRAPSRILPVDAGSRSVRHLFGPARVLRIRPDQPPPAPAAASGLYPHAVGWCLVVGAGAGVEAGDRVHVELARTEGVARFEATVRARGDAPEHLHTGEEAVEALILEPPAVVRLYNQRQAFRVETELPAAARLLGDPGGDPLEALLSDDDGPIDLTLTDLSTGGCAVRATAPLPEGARIGLRLDLPHQRVVTTARVLRAGPVEAGGLRRYGLRFEDLRQVDEDRIHSHVLACQRAALAG